MRSKEPAVRVGNRQCFKLIKFMNIMHYELQKNRVVEQCMGNICGLKH